MRLWALRLPRLPRSPLGSPSAPGTQGGSRGPRALLLQGPAARSPLSSASSSAFFLRAQWISSSSSSSRALGSSSKEASPGWASRDIIESSKKTLNLLQKEHPALKPTLSVVQVGDDYLGQETVRNIAEEIGLNIVHIRLPHDCTEIEGHQKSETT